MHERSVKCGMVCVGKEERCAECMVAVHTCREKSVELMTVGSMCRKKSMEYMMLFLGKECGVYGDKWTCVGNE